MNTLKVDNISKIYGNKQVLTDMSLEIEQGEVFGLLGPNGAGKSTLMKIITGYIRPNGGSVEVCRQRITDNMVAYKRNIGYLPEHNPLYLDMFVREYLDYVAKLYQIPDRKQAIEEVIDKTGLQAEANKLIRNLSKGYRQRVGLAQAIVHRPKLLILDEPTTGLDPNQIVEIRQLIANFGKEHTVLFSTHIMQEVTAICTRAMLINKGKIVTFLQGEDLKIERLEKEFENIKS